MIHKSSLQLLAAAALMGVSASSEYYSFGPKGEDGPRHKLPNPEIQNKAQAKREGKQAKRIKEMSK